MAWTKARVIGKDFGFPLDTKEAKCSLQDLQSAYDYVQIHAVDRFHLQRHVPVQYFGHGLW